jgi:hypothetical protein
MEQVEYVLHVLQLDSEHETHLLAGLMKYPAVVLQARQVKLAGVNGREVFPPYEHAVHFGSALAQV